MTEFKQHSGYMHGKLLIATPNMNESIFTKSVIYVCAHNDTGAMGLIINHRIEDMKCNELLDSLNITSKIDVGNYPIFLGGPVESNKGFILHSSEYHQKSTLNIHRNISITSDVEIVKNIFDGTGPIKSLIMLGCAGWAKNQLEQELKDDKWIIASADNDLIFNTPASRKWQLSAGSLGISLNNYMGGAGHA